MARGILLVLFMVVGGTLGAWGQELKVGWMIFDLTELNGLLGAQGYPTLANDLFIWGGGGPVLLAGVLGEWSVMFSNWYGSTAVRQDDKLTRFALTWSGGIVEHPLLKGVPMPFALMVGLVGGVGVSSLTVLDHRSGSFQEALSSPAAAFFTRWFFTVGPQLSASIPLITFGRERALGLKLSVGYILTFDNGRWDQEGRALEGPPDRFNGWIIQIALGM